MTIAVMFSGSARSKLAVTYKKATGSELSGRIEEVCDEADLRVVLSKLFGL